MVTSPDTLHRFVLPAQVEVNFTSRPAPLLSKALDYHPLTGAAPAKDRKMPEAF